MTLYRRSFLFALVALSLYVFSPAFAAADPTAQFVQRMGDRALTSLTAKELSSGEREKRVRTLLQTNFDVDTIAKFALGTYWRTATESQKAKYLKLFEDMIVKTYAQRFGEYSGQSFKVGTTIEASAKDQIVNSQIVQKDGPPVAVQWRVRNSGGTMKIVDVIVEGVSMSVTQRSDFSAVIQSGGGKIDALIESLAQRQNKSAKK